MLAEVVCVLDRFIATSSGLQRTHVTPENDALSFNEIAGLADVKAADEDYSDAEAGDRACKPGSSDEHGGRWR